MTLTGADISGWQPGNVNLDGLDFVIVKVTEGLTVRSVNYAAQVAEARAAGKLIGTYHFADGFDAAAEARFYVSVADHRAGEDLALDVEAPFVNNCPDPVAWSLTFLQEVERLTGVKPYLYLNYSDRHHHNWQPIVDAGYGLWDAEYNGTGPADAAPWPFVAVWQNSDKNQTGGDSDQFFGDRQAWLKYGGETAAPAPDPAPAPAPPAPAPAPALAPSGGSYQVRPGDTLSAIATAHGTSWQAIEALNGLSNPNLIYPGQTLAIPGPGHPEPPAGPPSCIVDGGDSLSSIGAQFGVGWEEVAAINGIRPPYTIYPGQILRLR